MLSCHHLIIRTRLKTCWTWMLHGQNLQPNCCWGLHHSTAISLRASTTICRMQQETPWPACKFKADHYQNLGLHPQQDTLRPAHGDYEQRL